MHETLDCLQKQTIENWECVIVNDGSTDNSSAIAHQYAEKDPRYKVIDIQNAGTSNARNVGIKASQAKYILPLDADDLIAPSYAEKAIAYLDAHDDVKLVYCNAELFGNQTGAWILPECNPETLIWGNQIHCSAVYRRSDFDKTNGYNTNMKHGLEDWDFWITFLSKGDKTYRLPETLFFYRIQAGTRSSVCANNTQAMHNQVIMNHFDLYKPYLYKIFECNDYKKELEKRLNSKKYKLGSFLCEPFVFLKKLFSK